MLRDKLIAQCARRKGISDRSMEEHQWVSIDCRLHRHLYHKEFIPHPEYDLGLDCDKLMWLLVLPARLNHAFGKISTPKELQAHHLLHKYYDIDSGHHDDWFEDDSLFLVDDKPHKVDCKLFGKQLASFDDLCSLLEDSSLRSPFHEALKELNNKKTNKDSCYEEQMRVTEFNHQIQIINHLHELNDLPERAAVQETAKKIFILDDCGYISLKELNFNRIETGRGQRHFIELIVDEPTKKLASIYVSIIFTGNFIGQDYISGRLSASISLINHNNVSHKIVGDARYSLQTLNTNKSAGRIVIEYDIAYDEQYEDTILLNISILAFSQCTYSISLWGKFVHDLESHYVNELHSLLLAEKNIQDIQRVLHENYLDTRVLEYKLSLLTLICTKSEDFKSEIHRDISEIQENHMSNYDSTICNIEQRRVMKHLLVLEQKLGEVSRKLVVRCSMKEKTLREIKQLQTERQKYLAQLQNLKSDKNYLREQLCPSLIQVYEKCPANCHITIRFIKNILLMCTDMTSANKIKWMRNENSPNNKDGIISKKTTCSLSILLKSLISEIDKTHEEDGPFVSSALIHSTPQLFQKEALMVELKKKLSAVIFEIIKNEERAHHMIKDSSILMRDDDSLSGTFDSEEDEEDGFTPHSEILRARTNGDNKNNFHIHCKACNSTSCHWKSNIKYLQKVKYREHLTQQMLLNMKWQSQPSVHDEQAPVLSLNSNDHLTKEAELIDDECKLYNVDMELHNAFNKKYEKYIVIRSLHNYEMMMNTNHAILALEKEQERLVANLAAREIIHNILEWMDDGWYFKQQSHDIDSMPIVNHVHEDRVFVDQQEQHDQQEGLILNICCWESSYRGENILKEIHGRGTMVQRDRILSTAEKSIKIFALCFALRYFNTLVFREAMYLVGRNGSVMDITSTTRRGTTPAVEQGVKVCSNKNSNRGEQQKEKTQAVQEEECRNAARQRDKRLKRILDDCAEDTASINILERQRKRDAASSSKVQMRNFLESDHGCNVQILAPAVTIQKYYRGHTGRKAALLWRNEYKNIQVWRALYHSCAITITRYWRGYSSRRMAAFCREKMVKYFINLRKAEAKEDEDVFLNMGNFNKTRRLF